MTMTQNKTKQKAASHTGSAGPRRHSRVGRTAELSEEVIDHVATGQRGAIEAVRKFMKSADRAIPALGVSPTRRHAVIDSALEMSERLVKVEHDLARNVVHSAGETLSGSR